jgi:hypothetical protein
MKAQPIPSERAGLKLVRMAIEQVCPAGVLPSEQWVTGFYGPEPVHEGEALAKVSSKPLKGSRASEF